MVQRLRKSDEKFMVYELWLSTQKLILKWTSVLKKINSTTFLLIWKECIKHTILFHNMESRRKRVFMKCIYCARCFSHKIIDVFIYAEMFLWVQTVLSDVPWRSFLWSNRNACRDKSSILLWLKQLTQKTHFMKIRAVNNTHIDLWKLLKQSYCNILKCIKLLLIT